MWLPLPELGFIPDGTVHTETDVAVLGGHDAAEAGAEAAGHSGFEGELSGRVAFGAERPDCLEHLGRAARVHGRAVQLLPQQLGDEARMADGAVVCRDTRVAREQA